MNFKARMRYWLRGWFHYFDSSWGGQKREVRLPNGRQFTVKISSHDSAAFQETVDHEIRAYWQQHQPTSSEVHLDVGAQVGSYTLLAAGSGATVYSFEPDPNNRRFLRRNLRANGLASNIVKQGTWNRQAVLPWRTHSAMSSIEGVGMLPDLPALDHIEVDTLDHLVAKLGLKRIDVIKMDIEGAEIEAIEGAEKTIKTHRPILLIEAYHLRDGEQTKDRVLKTLRQFGIPEARMKVTDQSLIVAEGY